MTTIDQFFSAIDNHGFKRKGNNCQCPSHQGTKLSLSAKQDGDKLLLYCHSNQCNFTDILGSLGLTENYEPEIVEQAQWKIDKKEREQAYKTKSARDMLSEHIDDMHYADPAPMIEYLASRGIKNIPFSYDIGFLEKCYYAENEYYPAIFSIIRDRFNNIIAGHRGYLNCDKVPNRKKMPSLHDGFSKNGAVRVITSNSRTLIVAEGLETLLSVYMLNSGRDANYWSTVDAGGMESLSIPVEFDKIEIYSDNDISKTGQRASKILSDRYDCSVFYAAKEIPDGMKGFDFNDLLRQKLGIT